ncbi:MAG: trypsin-like serine protease [Verrucomicrobia bacterium]|nr:trypsin-like serine protease [Verrucomicrobiota bacterium]
MNLRWLCLCGFVLLTGQVSSAAIATILAGGETALPADTPSGRLDTAGEFSFVGALAISNGSVNYRGSAVALSSEWVLTAGHNADLNDDGLPDAGWSGTFHLPGYGSFGVARAYTPPSFTGFANPSVNDDLALLHLAVPLPVGMSFPTLGAAGIGDVITLVGFGRSGYGSYGYTTSASLTDRRFGSNVIDSFRLDDEGSGRAEVFLYDFDAPATTGQPGGSLGNDVETIIGPGDSGGAALRQKADGSWELVGINTFTEGYGGRFGDTGGGVLVDPYKDWILQTTGIPEPACVEMLMLTLLVFILRRHHR